MQAVGVLFYLIVQTALKWAGISNDQGINLVSPYDGGRLYHPLITNQDFSAHLSNHHPFFTINHQSPENMAHHQSPKNVSRYYITLCMQQCNE